MLADYNFQIIYRPRKLNVKADVLTRRLGDLPVKGSLRTQDSILKPEHFINATGYGLNSTSRAFDSQIRELTPEDDFASSIRDAIESNANRHPSVALSECLFQDGMLLYNNLKYVPDNEELRTKIIRLYYEHPASGHPSRAAIFELVTRNY